MSSEVIATSARLVASMRASFVRDRGLPRIPSTFEKAPVSGLRSGVVWWVLSRTRPNAISDHAIRAVAQRPTPTAFRMVDDLMRCCAA